MTTNYKEVTSEIMQGKNSYLAWCQLVDYFSAIDLNAWRRLVLDFYSIRVVVFLTVNTLCAAMTVANPTSGLLNKEAIRDAHKDIRTPPTHTYVDIQQ